jgi:hypothetical protein
MHPSELERASDRQAGCVRWPTECSTGPGCKSFPCPGRRPRAPWRSRSARAGHRAWIVGGAVRDLALGRAIKDVDMASSASPDEVERAFPRTFVPGGAAGAPSARS